ncbi:nitrile hydratase subunit beta [uncultured Ruegeria sp.]|uniref:nitrile hydratase subunit beta n=1 Tax=uncultured Ruegeria sp. TaxID=259304 RepID=UPI00261E9F16|nr:nitrile hydratase subunit beta [uncultured Ruegeria sp.]
MNGGADLGGMMGFGPVVREENEPLFYGDWEKRALGMVIALGACGEWNLDMSRYARESLPTPFYLTATYYQIWLEAAVDLLKNRGMITEQEIASLRPIDPPIQVKRCLAPEDVHAVLFAGGPADRDPQGTPLFQAGDRVVTINDHPKTHTRLPRYARDKEGTITKVHGFHVFPDLNSQGLGENPHWLYQVTFSSRTLWGGQGNKMDKISLDLWEPYLRVRK